VLLLKLPDTKAIGNIRLGLIENGGITFTPTIFGVSTLPYLDTTTVPKTYFQGVNTDSLADSPYNISVNNKDNISSEYVYININLPRNNFIGAGVLRYKWFFDYSD